MSDPRAAEAWFHFFSEVMRGSAQAMEAWRSLLPGSSPEDLARLASGLTGSSGTGQGLAQDWMEDWWKAMGVVPRSRYLEVLERCETLNRRLEQAEATVSKLEKLLAAGDQAKAREMLGAWQSLAQETLKTQADWMKAWTSPGAEERAEQRPDSDPTPAGTAAQKGRTRRRPPARRSRSSSDD